MKALHRLADLLGEGTGILGHRLRTWLLEGGVRSAAKRGLGAGLLVWVVGSMAYAAPVLTWLVVGGWCVAAWRAAREVERQAEAESAFVVLLRDAIGDRNGVLLADVLLLLQRDQLLVGWDVADVRAQCEALDIPVRDSIKVGGSVSIGVHIDDLTAVWDVEPTPPPKINNPSRDGRSAGNYPTTPERAPIAEGVAWTVHASPRAAEHAAPEPEPSGFDLHLADALRILGDH